MILGIGIDIVDINRISHWLNVNGLPERYFCKSELDLIRKKGKDAAMSLAAHFAAKEAFGKALGSGLSGIKLKDITVENMNNGKPCLRLFGTAEKALNKAGAKNSHISLTHEKGIAAAVVLIEN